VERTPDHAKERTRAGEVGPNWVRTTTEQRNSGRQADWDPRGGGGGEARRQAARGSGFMRQQAKLLWLLGLELEEEGKA
jgi:hypothetical protein